MNCEEVRAAIECLHDGEAGPEDVGRVEAHVSACESCRAASERLSTLSALLRKSPVPAPSAELDERLAHAFRRRRGPGAAAAPPWWRRLFVGSVSIPKPAFAAALVAVAAALVGAGMLGRIASGPDAGAAVVPMNDPAAPPPAQPAAGPAKIVEVPVVRERVVTRTVVVFRDRPSADRGVKSSAAVGRSDRDLAMSGTVGPNGYFTVANLSDFQPAREMRARVIKEAEAHEK